MKIEWTANEAILPRYGHAAPGKIMDLPDSAAAIFINQGKAKPVVGGQPKPKRKKED